MKKFLFNLKLIFKGIFVPLIGTGTLFVGIYGLCNLYKLNSWFAVGEFVVCILLIIFGLVISAYVGASITNKVDEENSNPKVLFFNKRKKLADMCDVWIQNNKISSCPLNVVTFLDGNHLLNVDATIRYIDEHLDT